jgi:hypothetical protein
MKKSTILKIIIGIVAIIVLLRISIPLLVEPWIERKIVSTMNEEMGDYIVEVDQVNVNIFKSRIDLENISIRPRQEHVDRSNFIGDISSIKLKGIDIVKFIIKKNIDISELTISNSKILGNIFSSEEPKKLVVSPVNIRVGKVYLDTFEVAMINISSALSVSVKEGSLTVYDLDVSKNDTLSAGMIGKFDFKAYELSAVKADSMYSYLFNGILFTESSNTLAIDSFYIFPNYGNYEFTSKYQIETDRVEASFRNIIAHDFPVAAYLRSRSIQSSYIEIGHMDLDIFRDKRKRDNPEVKTEFQDLIYNYPGTLRIDSIGLIAGNVTYTEHGPLSNEPGRISFNRIESKIYRITNDTLYKGKNEYIVLDGKAHLMDAGLMTIQLKAKLFDPHNTFTVVGKVSGMEGKRLNPMLEKNAYLYVNSGKIDAIAFNFTANSTESTGQMNLLYHDLDMTVKNKQTDDTTAIAEKFISLFANYKILNSNPLPRQEVRVGQIYFARDPKKFIVNYCFKSILSGIKSSIIRGA